MSAAAQHIAAREIPADPAVLAEMFELIPSNLRNRMAALAWNAKLTHLTTTEGALALLSTVFNKHVESDQVYYARLWIACVRSVAGY